MVEYIQKTWHCSRAQVGIIPKGLAHTMLTLPLTAQSTGLKCSDNSLQMLDTDKKGTVLGLISWASEKRPLQKSVRVKKSKVQAKTDMEEWNLL